MAGSTLTFLRNRLTMESMARFFAGVVYFLFRPVVPMALGLAVGKLTGWEKGLMVVAIVLFIADSILTSMLRLQKRRSVPVQSEPSGGFLEFNGQAVPLTDEDAERLHDFVQSLAAKQQRSTGPLQ